MSEPITIRYRIEQWEFMRACQAHGAAHGAGTLSNLVVGAVAIILGAALIRIRPWIALGAISVGGILVVSTWIRSALWRRAYREAKKFQGEIKVVFRADAVHVETLEGTSDLPWSFFTRYLNAPGHVLLYIGKNNFSIIPKRAFTDEEAVDRFLALVRKKLKKTGCLGV